MSRNDSINILLIIGVGLVVGSTAATIFLIGVNADVGLLVGAMAAVWSAALTGVLCRWH